MQRCNACHVDVLREEHFCPLCGTELVPAEDKPGAPPRNLYPDLSRHMAKYNLFRRICLFLTFFGCGFSVLVNLLVNPNFLWSLIVVAAALYSWITIPPLLSRGTNSAKQITITVVVTALLAVALDYIIGYIGWSVTFVVPSLLSAGILGIGLMVVFNRTRWAQYVLYQVIIGVFGFVPLLLYFLGVAQNLVLVLITAGLALASLLVTIVFADRSIKNEFIKRFHY